MRIPSTLVAIAFLIAVPSAFTQDQAASPPTPPMPTSPAAAPAGAPSDAEMMKQMIELSKLNENHKLIGNLAGTWNYTVKFWMTGDPSLKPQESKGVAVRKPIWGGRYYTLDVSGKMQMPGEDGKMKEVVFKGMGLEGYDNAKKKFVGSWMDNMGTGIMMAEGTYDPATQTFTYTGEYEQVPGMPQKIRETIKVVDKDHHTFEWYENRGGNEVKTLEINYTRAKGK